MSGNNAGVFRIDPNDSVAVALRDFAPNETFRLDGPPIIVLDAVPRGHKVAIVSVRQGEPVRKYGWPIGSASRAIVPGEHVHTHNLVTALTGGNTSLQSRPPRAAQGTVHAAGFDGYRRADGRVGTRNEIWILPTVGCVARTAERIAAEAATYAKGRVDGVHAFVHPYGCSQLGDDLGNTRRVLAALASHPNAGGVLLVGLGCENNQLSQLLAETHFDPSRVRSFNAQGAEDEVEQGLSLVHELIDIAAVDKREPRPLSDLVVGLKCGGSDGFSGLTANPLVGKIADAATGAGGTAILTEIPEIFGAEHLLMARAINPRVRDGIAGVVSGFKQYFLDQGQPVSENPSPGNIEGGITTLEEKSLGAVQKAGSSAVSQVLRYGERAQEHGLALLEAPGNDAVSSTALVAAGATVLLFTTGRGTPLGFPAPTLKIATNTELAMRKPRWIDFDAGILLSGTSMDDAARGLMDLLVATASGKPTRSEANGERDIAIWKTGVTL